MVCEWGMSDKLGPLSYGEKEGEVFLGRDYGHVKNYSEATAMAIDEEIRKIVEECYERTRDILSQHKDALIKVSEALLERENMDGSEIRAMIFGTEEGVKEGAEEGTQEGNEEGTQEGNEEGIEEGAEDATAVTGEEAAVAKDTVAPGEGPCVGKD
jgi:cell division protease FtsH